MTAASTPPRAPRVGELTAVDSPRTDGEWYGVLVSGDFAGLDLTQLDAQSVRGERVSFVGTDLQQSRMIDAGFDACDLAGARFDEAALTRVEFRDCRLSGAQFNAARLTDVRFVGCRMDGASLRMARGERVWFEDCVLSTADFYAAELAGARFERCSLDAADFSQARIPDVSVTGSRLDGVRGVGGLQRPTIDPTQVLPLAYSLMALHGVTIDDGSDADTP